MTILLPCLFLFGCLATLCVFLDAKGHDPASFHHPHTHSRRRLESSLNDRLHQVIQQINEVANLIYQRYEFHHQQRYQFFIESSNIPCYGWDLMKYKFAKKILQASVSASTATATASDGVSGNSGGGNKHSEVTYRMIFGGSSVTAGHDNYYHQAYPFVFEKRMKTIFSTLGITLEVHNIAQGANNCRPSIYCYEAMGGSNADFLGWEQSFNCGRSRDIFELIARMAYWDQAVVYYVASGAFLTTDCAPSKDAIPWISEDWTPEKAGITDRYTITPESAKSFRQKLSDWYDDGNSVSRFTNQVYGGLYKGVGPHGYSVWAHSSKLCNNGTGCNAVDMRGPCYDQGGAHWMTAETSYYGGIKGRSGKSWHPPAGMHLLRGEVLTYNMAHILADAAFMILEDLSTMTVAAAMEKYDKAWQEVYVAVPERALHIHQEESQHKATCYTNFKPHYNPKGLLDRIIIGKPKGFNLVEPKLHHDNPFGYGDFRPYYDASGPDNEISFRISNVRAGAIRVCGYDRKESLIHAEFFLDPAYPFPKDKDNSEIVYKPTEKQYELPKHIYVQDECTRLPDIPLTNVNNVTVEHVLTIKTKPAGKAVSVTHVIIF